jgi:hypothetical protein
MLIEQAFLKLPELLLSNFDHGSEVESTIVHLFASALQMEMNARNIPRPFASILTEKPYEGVSSDRKAVRADLYVDLSSAVRCDERMLAYGVRPKNWIEAKAPLMTGRRSPTALRPQLLVRDYFRLCLLPKEWPGPSTALENGRYLLWILDKDPKGALPEKSWVRPMLDPGIHTVKLNTHVSEALKAISLEASVHTLTFEPYLLNAPTPLFWGYLLRITQFRVWDTQRSFVAGTPQARGFTHEAIDALKALRQAFLLREDGSASED